MMFGMFTPAASLVEEKEKRTLGALLVTPTQMGEVLLATHGNMPLPAFRESVRAWLDTAKHPKTGLPYTEMLYQPMLWTSLLGRPLMSPSAKLQA